MRPPGRVSTWLDTDAGCAASHDKAYSFINIGLAWRQPERLAVQDETQLTSGRWGVERQRTCKNHQ